MRSRYEIADARIGAAAIHLMSAADVVSVTVELCEELCPVCPARPRRMEF